MVDQIGALPQIGQFSLSGSSAPRVSAADVLPKADSNSQVVIPQDAPDQLDLQQAQQRRFEAVRQAAQQVANPYVVSDRKFTIFKDATGQYITRFTSLKDGRVTYIPEPNLVSARSTAPTIVLKV